MQDFVSIILILNTANLVENYAKTGIMAYAELAAATSSQMSFLIQKIMMNRK